MRSILEFFVTRHLLVNVVAAALAITGILATSNLKREFIPSFDTPIIWVTARLPGAAARDIETKITIPIEEAIEEIEGIAETQTVISDSVSFTTVELYNDYNSEEIGEGERDIRDAIEAITDFPPEMEDEPNILHLNPARDVVIEVALTGPLDQVEDAAEFLERRIERLDRISNVEPLGLQEPEVRIFIDPAKALAHRLTLNDVITAVQNRNVSSTGGSFESSETQRQIVMWSRYEEPEDVADTILKFDEQSGLVRIKDIARIESGREDTGLIVRNDGSRGVTLLVHKREDADIIEAVQDVRELVAKTALPADVKSQLTADNSYATGERLKIMATNGLLGMVLVGLLLFYFIRLQPAIWILIGIPVVFLGALMLFSQLGLSLNLISMGGFIIVLGMIVDDAVVVAERITLKQGQGMPPAKAAVEGALEMMPAVIAATLTTCIAFLPLIAIGGLPGKITWQFPVVVVLALMVSVFESFFVLPAHMSTIKTSAQASKRAAIIRLEQLYKRALTHIFRARFIVVGVAVTVFLVIMIAVRPLVPLILFPQDDANRLWLKVSAPLGTSLEETEAIVADLEQQVKEHTLVDLDLVMARVGHQNNLSQDKTTGEAGNEALIIAQFVQVDREYTNAEWITILQEKMRYPEGVTGVFQSEYSGPPTDQPVTVHILANDHEIRRAVAFEVAEYLRKSAGVIEVEIDERPGVPQIDLNLDYEKLALLGLDAQTVGQTLTAAFHGIEASEHRDVEDVTKLRVMFEPAARADINALLDVPVRARNGNLVRLRDVVQPIETPSETRIYHRDGFRSSTVRASFTSDSGITALPFAQKMERELFPRFAEIPDLLIFNGGEADETEKTSGNMGTAGVLAFLGITVVIWIMLGSLIETLFIVSVIPFAFAGVVLTFYLHGYPLSMISMLGTIGLAGVVVNAAIVMVDNIHRRLREAGENIESRIELVIDAVVERLRPILVTTLTTLGGVLPTAYGFLGYDHYISPTSLALGWGLVFSTFITLFVVPVLYSLAYDLRLRISPRLRLQRRSQSSRH